ncbi:hypothetical protein K490DRAFT_57024 [Saccharata proteae CBS 121410]|uniref:BHLH domain-containing protein n=1 Tax=Saccharata proteae CBS 121410 TaxID=1314787 RepID=A0A9P4LXA5_9PEZI|nr:hypothetical protein K490DRAFT_57024 [Saccharata proteae CBS 121410]
MESIEPDMATDDPLALEDIAVGPYCIFDGCKPTPSESPPETTFSRPATPTEHAEMEDPMISNEFPFAAGIRPPWMVSSADDLSLAGHPAETFAQGNWEEWMRWDPAAQPPAQPTKELNAQGPLCYLRLDTKSPIHSRRQDSQLGIQSNGLPTTSAAFTFGGSMDNAPAFSFETNELSSPSAIQAQQNPAFFTDNPIWPEGPQIEPGEGNLFSPVSFNQQRSPIVAPPHSTPSLHHSPSSISNTHTNSSSSHSSPEPTHTNGSKKRKSIQEDDSADSKSSKGPPIKKTAHNMIEKRYRTNLNDKIAALRDSVPSLRVMSRTHTNGNEEEDDPEDLEGLTPAHKLNKATVLSKATEYIRHLEKRNKRLFDELEAVKQRLESYDKFTLATPMTMTNPVNTPDGMRYQDQDPFAAAAARQQALTNNAQGMIPVPESITNLQAMAAQQQYAQQGAFPTYAPSPAARHGAANPQPLVNGRRGNGLMSKMMIGSLAGLMLLEMEGLREHEESEETQGRGLFALPVTFGRYAGSILPKYVPRYFAYAMASLYQSLPLIKLFLLIGVFVYLLSPLLDSRPKQKKKAVPPIRLSPAPSPASPVEMRHKAWLTAIQTVWVPQHSFFLEAAAVGLKALKLSLRSLIGWDGYALLTGTTKEQEAARVKAWSIALDAQLTGGDAEISKSRLVLTIMASGTLPDTPARLMLKALHIRVLLWEVAKAGYGSWYMFEELSAKWARHYWIRARSAHKETLNSRSDSQTEKLPEHLAALLELDCDEVMVDKIVHRAYNLAWNKPSAQNTDADEAMDSVVEDFAISSPLDALAAWFSSFALNRTLVAYLEATDDKSREDDVSVGLDTAIRTAPPNSVSSVRALVARAALIDTNRDANILAAFDDLPSQPQIPALNKASASHPRALLMNVVGEAPVAADVRKSLTLTKCLALAEQFSATHVSEARVRATFVVNNTFLPDACLTLLSFVAASKVLAVFSKDAQLLAESRQGLERIAGAMRVWVGREAGRRSGLGREAKSRIVQRCVSVSKMLVGMGDTESSEEGDAGYASQSDDGVVDGKVRT